MLLSLVAHAVGYEMMVGAHNIIYVRRMWEVFTVIHHVRQMTMPITLLMPKGMWGLLPCLPGMGIDGAHNTVGQNVGAHNTAWVLTCLEGCRAPF